MIAFKKETKSMLVHCDIEFLTEEEEKERER
jgi:hypothetical protein